MKKTMHKSTYSNEKDGLLQQNMVKDLIRKQRTMHRVLSQRLEEEFKVVARLKHQLDVIEQEIIRLELIIREEP